MGTYFIEPVEHDRSAGADALIADVCVRGVWEPQNKALFDITVVDTDVRSYHACSSMMFYVLPRLRRSINIYRVIWINVPHLLLYASVDGMLGAEAEFFIKRLGDFWLQGGKDLIVW